MLAELPLRRGWHHCVGLACRALSSGKTWAGTSALLIGYLAVALATGIAVLAGGTRHPAVALGLVAAAVLVVAAQTRPATALGLGVLGWLFFDGFIAGRHAQLGWHGTADLRRLGLLAATAVAGAALGWAWRRFAPRRASRQPLHHWSEPYPVLPEQASTR